MRRSRHLTILLLAVPLLAGFDTSRRSVPAEEILSGGPPKDGIPALLVPKFVPADRATYLDPDDGVIGVVRDGVARAYPLRILAWHEVVNDRVGSADVAVTYCPLTASGVVYERTVHGRTRTFGVSGLLYQSNLLMYDHQSENLWSQLKAEAVAGSEAGTRLRALPSDTTTWRAWRRAHPDTVVLSDDTGFRRDYREDPYATYDASPELMFPVKRLDDRLPVKTRVVGVEIAGQAKAYPLTWLRRSGAVRDDLGGTSLRVEYDAATDTVRVARVPDDEPVVAVSAYWFAWAAFHPSTAVAGVGRDALAPSAPPLGAAEGSPEVAIVHHAASWTDILGLAVAGPGGDRAPSLLVIHGELRNLTQDPLGHVKLAFELLDADGGTVAREEGYNREAEALQPLDSPDAPPRAETAATPPPIPAAGSATFRMMFLREDLPPFRGYRIRVVEASPVR